VGAGIKPAPTFLPGGGFNFFIFITHPGPKYGKIKGSIQVIFC
jgi:hypothetical protein